MVRSNSDRARELRHVVSQVRKSNEKTYGSEEQRASIRTAVARSFTLPGVYLFELVQNALDVGASRIRVDWSEHALVLEHDAAQRFDRESIEALSKLGMSTKKRLDTVGFMGLGFKSVFERFERVDVSDADLRMFFEVGYDEGAYGDRHKRWVDLVLPRWDDDITAPSQGFTTRFGLVHPLPSGSPLANDVRVLIPHDDEVPDALALLALRGLRGLVVGDAQWRIDVVAEGEYEFVTATNGESNIHWFVARSPYRPSKLGLKCLLEHRDFKVDVMSEAVERDREVVVLIQTDEGKNPWLDDRGRVFATLPTGVHLKLRLLLQADLLLNTGRDGLVNVPGNAWQAEIADQVPALLKKTVTWIRDCAASDREAFGALELLADVGPTSPDLHGALADQRRLKVIADALAEVDFLPIRTEGPESPTTARPGDVGDVPAELMRAFLNVDDLRPSRVLGRPIIDPVFATNYPRVVDALRAMHLLPSVRVSDLEKRWPATLEHWWAEAIEEASENDRAVVEERLVTAIFELTAGIARLALRDARWGDLACVLTAAGKFRRPVDVQRWSASLPGLEDELGAALRTQMPEVMVPADRLLHPLFAKQMNRQTDDASVVKKLIRQGTEVSPYQRIRNALPGAIDEGRVDSRLLLLITEWAYEDDNLELLTHTLVEDPRGQITIARASEAVVAEPFVEGGHARRGVFPHRKPISASLLPDADAVERRRFLERIEGVSGPLKLIEHERTTRSLKDFQAWSGVNERSSSQHGYKVLDRDFEPGVDLGSAALCEWLRQNYTSLHKKGRVRATWSNHGERSRDGTVTCTWVQRLEGAAWVPTAGGGLARPAAVVLEREEGQQPLAEIDPALAQALVAAGVRFGTEVPRPGPVARLRARGRVLPAAELARLLQEAVDHAKSSEDREELLRTVRELPAPLVDGRRFRVERLVQSRDRSDLRGFVAATEDLAKELRSALERVPGLSIPAATTGRQALMFLREVWRQAETRPVDTETVRVLPRAYEYLVVDAKTDDELAARFRELRKEVHVFDGRQWLALSTSRPVFIDDLYDEEFRELVANHGSFASPNQFGDQRDAVECIASALGIRLLSEYLRPDQRFGDERNPAWLPRLRILLKVLALNGMPELLVTVHGTVEVVVRDKRFDRHAAVSGGRLRVVESPTEFACDATAIIVDHYRLDQRGRDVPQLTKTLIALVREEEFFRELARLVRQLQLDDAGVDAILLAATESALANAGPCSNEPDADTTDPDDAGLGAYRREYSPASEGPPEPGKDEGPEAHRHGQQGTVAEHIAARQRAARDDEDVDAPLPVSGPKTKASVQEAARLSRAIPAEARLEVRSQNRTFLAGNAAEQKAEATAELLADYGGRCQICRRKYLQSNGGQGCSVFQWKPAVAQGGPTFAGNLLVVCGWHEALLANATYTLLEPREATSQEILSFVTTAPADEAPDGQRSYSVPVFFHNVADTTDARTETKRETIRFGEAHWMAFKICVLGDES